MDDHGPDFGLHRPAGLLRVHVCSGQVAQGLFGRVRVAVAGCLAQRIVLAGQGFSVAFAVKDVAGGAAHHLLNFRLSS